MVETGKMTQVQPDHFKFSTAILTRLGEELNPHPDQGIIELVRNAYDADASNCIIELNSVNRKGGSIRITDDGTGMDIHGISNGWLVLGRSEKERRKRTKKWGRLPVGDKGLGRLAALRMGRHATLLTRPQNEPLFEYRLVIDWDRYDNVSVVEDVNLNIEIGANTQTSKHGTEIVIDNLTCSFSRKEIERLARAFSNVQAPTAITNTNDDKTLDVTFAASLPVLHKHQTHQKLI